MKRLYLQKSCIEKQYVHIRNSLIAVSMACLSTSMMPCYAQNAKPKIATRGVISSQPGDYKQVATLNSFIGKVVTPSISWENSRIDTMAPPFQMADIKSLCK